MARADSTSRGPRFEDLAGQCFGRWTVLGPTSKPRYWMCRCSCVAATQKAIFAGNLTSGKSRSCGCLKKELQANNQACFKKGQHPHNFRDLTGRRFGRLTVLRQADMPGRWVCKCGCAAGTITTVFTGNLTRLHTTSCGCRHREEAGNSARTHGMTQTKEHSCWCGIKKRCYNERCKSYRDYGARGVCVCLGWLESFASFLNDVGTAPSRAHSIDRIDTNGRYSCGHCEQCQEQGWPANCRWATRTEQARNTRDGLFVTYQGRTLHLKEWAKETGISYHTLFTRIFVKKQSPEVALLQPTATALHAYNGKSLTLKQWAKEVGIRYQTLVFRLAHGWDLALALSTPAVVGQKIRCRLSCE